MNPEFRQTLNTISRNLETANEAAQENFYTFTQLFIDPCLSGIKSGIHDCTALCFPVRAEQLRRKRGRSRGRAELNFDFYDDWDDDEGAGSGLLGWGNDELDSLLAGTRSPTNAQPGKQRPMNYGSRGRRRGTVGPVDVEQDPTIIPSSSHFGFLERLPWKFGSRSLRYKPSAANLEEHPGAQRGRDPESEPSMEEDEEGGDIQRHKTPRHGRQRSGTAASQSTTNSLSSRGDLIMSDEDEDAVPLDDEFAVMLGRRITNTDDQSSGRVSTGRRPDMSRNSTRTVSSKSATSGMKSRRSSSKKSPEPMSPSDEISSHPSIVDLKEEEEEARLEQESEVQQKQEAAQKLATSRGLSSTDLKASGVEVKPHDDEEPEAEVVSVTPPMRQASAQPMDEPTSSKSPTRDHKDTRNTEPP